MSCCVLKEVEIHSLDSNDLPSKTVWNFTKYSESDTIKKFGLMEKTKEMSLSRKATFNKKKSS